MRSCTGERRGALSAERGTWVRLGVALVLAAVAAAVPHVGFTAAEFTDAPTTSGQLRTATTFPGSDGSEGTDDSDGSDGSGSTDQPAVDPVIDPPAAPATQP
ncbi:hypothetical protein [Cellulomonas sp. HZM]|uniref:hypothetical protein n=1 Tax=Cellulomonas sp. HZM TaxID=1454010 RepID=UPI000493B09D|nr:hypothetical protein [Cellulomonas sp. HZM]